MRASFHHLSEEVAIESHADCSHFCDSVATIYHITAPSLGSSLEGWEISWGFVLGDIFHYISDIPKISPFGVEGGRGRCDSLVIAFECS
jgi:hypothetical protein